LIALLDRYVETEISADVDLMCHHELDGRTV